MADSSSTPSGPTTWAGWAQAAADYWVDALQRGVLTLDVLRERGNQYLEHERSGKPPVLVFDHELVVDGRTLPQPANYALARITPPAGYPTSQDDKRPFVVIDPRAGHGPGIGGFKLDSEIGIALQHGHPCYFVTFFPQPEPGQTIASVCAAEIAFLREVNARHPQAEAKPFVIGNCQGGWALMMLAALQPDLVGTILLAGSPISYWAGVAGKNPMRYTGGLLGGTWLASLAGDLGHGRFDGAYLVNNFEAGNPSNTYWTKLNNLYRKVDTEAPRFLEFERWWGGHYLMNKEEMEWITQNLFVGNRLSAGKIVSPDGQHRVDIRNIRSPIVVFASWGDNITPPQQALNWIPDVYASVDDIRANDQTIVYCLHEKIGHLGIFVSADVAKKQTTELAGALDLIETLPPGLYEAQIEDTRPDMPGVELTDGRYLIRFEPRTLDDILALDDGRDDERAFEVVRRVAEVNQGLYDRYASPLVRALSSESSARALRMANPARAERYLFSDLAPWMPGVQPLAEAVRAQRRPVDASNPFAQLEAQASRQIAEAWNRWGDLRDQGSEQLFNAVYATPWMAMLVGLSGRADQQPKSQVVDWANSELRRLKRLEAEAFFEQGSLVDAGMRVLLYQGGHDKVGDERPFNLLRRMVEQLPLDKRPTLATLKQAAKRQATVLALDEERAVAALPKLVPGDALRHKVLDAALLIGSAASGALPPDHLERHARLREVLGVPQLAAADRQTPPESTGLARAKRR